jgi:hypothetical protein
MQQMNGSGTRNDGASWPVHVCCLWTRESSPLIAYSGSLKYLRKYEENALRVTNYRVMRRKYYTVPTESLDRIKRVASCFDQWLKPEQYKPALGFGGLKQQTNGSGINPVEYNVIVLPKQVEEKTSGGLYLPARDQGKRGIRAERRCLGGCVTDGVFVRGLAR